MSKKRLKLSNPRDVRQSLARIANMVLNDEVDPKQANAIMYACNSILSAIRTDEQEQRLCELEQLMKERGLGS